MSSDVISQIIGLNITVAFAVSSVVFTKEIERLEIGASLDIKTGG